MEHSLFWDAVMKIKRKQKNSSLLFQRVFFPTDVTVIVVLERLEIPLVSYLQGSRILSHAPRSFVVSIYQFDDIATNSHLEC